MVPGSVKLAICTCALALLPAVPAAASERWSVRGAGWGHGVGMSQYGALGLAKQGRGYREILGHYYRGTRVARGGTSVARVLLQANRSTVTFTGAVRAGGRGLRQDGVYKATRQGANVVLRSQSGRPLKTLAGVLPVAGGATTRLLGGAGNGVRDGLYRGSLEIRTAAGPGLNAVNTLPIENYLQGVVPAESPPIWPREALRAQAVAARTYASATSVSGKGFDQYPDTRSQVYRGFLAETASTNDAVASTAGEVVTYGGEVVVTYFFSTSGGHTEHVENVFGNSAPRPWLRGVEDPFDDASPYHRWGPYTWTARTIDAKLGSWSKGRFRGIEVLQRGASPRVVRAIVRGSRGDTRVTGPQLRGRLGLRDSWFFLRRVSSETSGAKARVSSGSRELTAIHGEVAGTTARFVQLQRREGKGWRTVVDVPLTRSATAAAARYRFHVAAAGTYRVLAGWAPGPAVEAR